MYKKVCIEDINTSPWQMQSHGYDILLDAKIAAAKVFTVKHGALVKKFGGKWAVFFLSPQNANNNQ